MEYGSLITLVGNAVKTPVQQCEKHSAGRTAERMACDNGSPLESERTEMFTDRSNDFESLPAVTRFRYPAQRTDYGGEKMRHDIILLCSGRSCFGEPTITWPSVNRMKADSSRRELPRRTAQIYRCNTTQGSSSSARVPASDSSSFGDVGFRLRRHWSEFDESRVSSADAIAAAARRHIRACQMPGSVKRSSRIAASVDGLMEALDPTPKSVSIESRPVSWRNGSRLQPPSTTGTGSNVSRLSSAGDAAGISPFCSPRPAGTSRGSVRERDWLNGELSAAKKNGLRTVDQGWLTNRRPCTVTRSTTNGPTAFHNTKNLNGESPLRVTSFSSVLANSEGSSKTNDRCA